MMLDGVTQYQLDWRYSPPVVCEGWQALNDCRTAMHDRGVIGQCAERYGGVGFGNVSCRLRQDEFLVSGTQTGHLRVLAATHYAHVLRCDVQRNYVLVQGPMAPSSEAMTHFMIYQCAPAARFVVHVHAPSLWRAAGSLSIPMTPVEVGYGTPAMAAAVAAIIRQQSVCMLAMGGHEDGVIAWGDDIQALRAMLCDALDPA